MEDFFTVSGDKLAYSARALRDELLRRGWKEGRFIRSRAITIIFATRPDGKKMRFCGCFPDETSVIGSRIADDKVLSYEILKEAGVKQPETVFLSADENEMRQQIEDFLTRHQKVVVKPVDGAHGRDVMMDITDVETAMDAAKNCNRLGERNALLQEQLLAGQTEMRSICIDGKYIAAYERIPAAVTGDGIHNISELIEIENNTLRDVPYRGMMAYIDVKAANRYIAENNIDTAMVPEMGEKVRVLGICNVGMGGTVKEIELSEEKVKTTERIAEATGLPIVGVDFLGDYVIEINAGPSLYWPTGDGNEDKCVKAYAGYLERQ